MIRQRSADRYVRYSSPDVDYPQELDILLPMRRMGLVEAERETTIWARFGFVRRNKNDRFPTRLLLTPFGI